MEPKVLSKKIRPYCNVGGRVVPITKLVITNAVTNLVMCLVDMDMCFDLYDFVT